MRLGKDVLEADLYEALGVLPDATESEIRVAYRRQVRTSHPDLNQEDPDAEPRMLRLNMAARVLLDPALRRAYTRHRAPRAAQTTPRSTSRPPRQPAWFERNEQSYDNDWAAVPAPATHEHRARFIGFFRELRGRDGQLSLQLQEAVEALSGRQQLSIAACLFAIAVCLIVIARPKQFVDDSVQPASVSAGAVYR